MSQQQISMDWKKLARARSLLAQKMEHLMPCVLALSPEVSTALPTMAVTPGGRLFMNPSYVAKQSVPALAADLAHECWHVLRDTHGRTEALGCLTDQDRELSNIAADMPINEDIERAGLPIITAPIPGVSAKQYGFPSGRTHEDYYALLKKRLTQPHPTQGCGRGSCGSGGGSPAQPFEAAPDPNAPSAPGASPPGERPSYDLDRIRQQVAGLLAGKGKGDASLWAESYLAPPVVPWKSELARYARSAINGRTPNRTLAKFNKIQGGIGFDPRMPRLAAVSYTGVEAEVMTDTSGSMSSVGEKVLTEVEGILRAVRAKITLVAVDDGIQASGRVKRIDDARPLMRGGGGTDFREYFERVATMRRPPDVIVIVTDGYAAGIPSWCKVPVIWCITPGGRPPVGWGRVVQVTA